MQNNPILLDFEMPIKTKRLILRPLSPGDGSNLNKAISEVYCQITEWLPWKKEKPSIAESEAFVRESYAKFILRYGFVFGLIYNTEIVGICSLNYVNWKLYSCNIGYWCSKSYQNKGYISEAVIALSEFAKLQLKIKRINLYCDDENIASIKVAEKTGFHLDARAKGLFCGEDSSYERRMNRLYSKIFD